MTLESCDDLLDRFDSLWNAALRAHARPPGLLDFVASRSHSEGAALVDLVCIDLERRWRTYYRAGLVEREPLVERLPRCPLVEDYLVLLPALHAQRAALVQAEFEVRQRFGDRPTAAATARRVPDQPQLLAQLRAFAVACTKAELRLLRRGELLFRAPLPGLLQVGRSRTGDPPSPSLFTTSGKQRLVIAPHADNEISRDHLRMEVAAYERVEITNSSSYDQVRVHSGSQEFTLAPQTSQLCALPATITLVDRQLEIGLA